MTRFGVARMTVRQAIDSLVAEGIVERVRGRGTFVTRPRRRIGQLTSLTEELHRRKMTLESRTLSARREAASPRVARALGLTVGDPVIRWRPSLLWSPPDLSRARVDAPLPAWLPVIGFLQTTVDLLFALDAAPGHGHRYGPDQARCAP